jgi:hypothetical protein
MEKLNKNMERMTPETSKIKRKTTKRLKDISRLMEEMEEQEYTHSEVDKESKNYRKKLYPLALAREERGKNITIKPEKDQNKERPESTKETINSTNEEEEEWTDEDEKVLNGLLVVIENTKKRIAEIDEEIEKINQKENQTKLINEEQTTLNSITKEQENESIKNLKEMAEKEIEKSKASEAKEGKTYSVKDIKEKVILILQGIKQVKEIKSLKIEDGKNTIFMEAKINVKKGFLTQDVEINATLVNDNEENKVIVAGYDVDAGLLTSFIKPLISKNLNEVGNLLKEYIEKEENKKVEKIWIENGELKAL